MNDNEITDEIDKDYEKLLDAARGIDTKSDELNNDSVDESESKKSTDETSASNVIDMMLGKQKEKTINSEAMIQETQKRIWKSLKHGIEYDATVDRSDAFLREHVNEKLHMVVLYVDLVGSTNITLRLPTEKIAIIISSFAQEMALAIKQHNGYVLKFVGDAVIGYFMHTSVLLAADNAVSCAKLMIRIMDEGINPILNNYDYPDLLVHIGLDYGDNMVVRYGSDKEKSHVDILGPTMNIAAKIQSMAKPQQILIGGYVYEKIHPTVQEQFKKEVWSQTEWKYNDRKTGKPYTVYSLDG
jgi:class 3 adenylate cyclase|tara:strand:+ start:808 stop:1704 length:897 start_codon:yes stop_codon:yes gene_type:complete